MITALFELRSDPMILQLESHLQAAWSPVEHRPVDVFRLTLESRSAMCIAILFENLIGVRDVGPIFDILEQAASERLNYFTFRLSTPDYLDERPDHTLWLHYSPAVDSCLRSPDLRPSPKSTSSSSALRYASSGSRSIFDPRTPRRLAMNLSRYRGVGMEWCF